VLRGYLCDSGAGQVDAIKWAFGEKQKSWPIGPIRSIGLRSILPLAAQENDVKVELTKCLAIFLTLHRQRPIATQVSLRNVQRAAGHWVVHL
jgi:hypothetical protein